jgi:beta-glucosidase
MTLEVKIGQMTQVEKNSLTTPEAVTKYHIGSALSGGGAYPQDNSPQGWVNMVGEFQQAALQTRLGIPLLYGVDAVHGHNNLHWAVIFPHNIGLGRRIGDIPLDCIVVFPCAALYDPPSGRLAIYYGTMN